MVSNYEIEKEKFLREELKEFMKKHEIVFLKDLFSKTDSELLNNYEMNIQLVLYLKTLKLD